MESAEENELSPVFEGDLDAAKMAASYLNASGIHSELKIASGSKPGS